MPGARSRSILHPGRLPTLALLLVAVGLMLARPGAGPMAQPVFAQAQSDGLFYDAKGEPPPSIGVDSLASRLAGIDFGQLAYGRRCARQSQGPRHRETGEASDACIKSVRRRGVHRHSRARRADLVRTCAVQGRLDGVELGTFTLVVNGRVVIGTVRTPDRGIHDQDC